MHSTFSLWYLLETCLSVCLKSPAKKRSAATKNCFQHFLKRNPIGTTKFYNAIPTIKDNFSEKIFCVSLRTAILDVLKVKTYIWYMTRISMRNSVVQKTFSKSTKTCFETEVAVSYPLSLKLFASKLKSQIDSTCIFKIIERSSSLKNDCLLGILRFFVCVRARVYEAA